MYVKFKKGSLKVDFHGNALIVGDKITLDARSLTFPKDAKVYYAEPTKKKIAIIATYEPLELIERPPRVDMVHGEVKLLNAFELRAVDLDFEVYLTVVVPGSFLYDYAIITPSKTEIIASTKRKIYLEKTSKSSIVYLL